MVYVSATLRDIVGSGETERLGGILSWFNWGRSIQDDELSIILDQLRGLTSEWSAYRAQDGERTHLEALSTASWDFDDPIDSILADTYGFLRTHSAILARTKRVAAEFRRRGLAVLDLINRGLASLELRGEEALDWVRVLKRSPEGFQARLNLMVLFRLYPIQNAPVPHEIQVLFQFAGEIIGLIDP